ncbi:hypothetical protein [Candidatus Chloroploca asiatica]|uniref:hypothetical protein n=1 Tax=Candidatus Chloroploca asiatica TaxID=1506545 RepID=UPI0011444C35|nr:hypothetical protein [Candidatus Chloroploca asiatica]
MNLQVVSLFQLYAAISVLVRDTWLYLEDYPRDDAVNFQAIVIPIIETDQRQYPATTIFRSAEQLAARDPAGSWKTPEGFMAAAAAARPTIEGLDAWQIVHKQTTEPGQQIVSALSRQCGEALSQIFRQRDLVHRERILRVVNIYQQHCFAEDPVWYSLVAVVSTAVVSQWSLVNNLAPLFHESAWPFSQASPLLFPDLPDVPLVPTSPKSLSSLLTEIINRTGGKLKTETSSDFRFHQDNVAMDLLTLGLTDKSNSGPLWEDSPWTGALTPNPRKSVKKDAFGRSKVGGIGLVGRQRSETLRSDFTPEPEDYETPEPQDEDTPRAEAVDFAATPKRQPSYAHTGFSEDEAYERELDPTIPLKAGQSYLFWFELSPNPTLPGAIEEDNVPFDPKGELPLDAEIDVVLYTFPNGIDIDLGEADFGQLTLQPDGSGRVTHQPGGRVSIKGKGTQRLFFPVRTPSLDGEAQLRCSIYYKQILLQSRLIQVQVSHNPSKQEAAMLRSFVEYTRMDLHSDTLNDVEEQKLSVMFNPNSNATHELRFFGSTKVTSSAHPDAHKLQAFIDIARDALRKVAWGTTEEWDEKKHSYRYTQERVITHEQLKKDLVILAKAGYRIYDAIINAFAGGNQAADQLAELMRASGRLELVIKKEPNHILPIALMYDYRLDDALDPDAYTLCPAFCDALKDNTPLWETRCFTGTCPSRDRENNMICPSGFWGFRHPLGIPISIPEATNLPVVITWRHQLNLIIGVATDLEYKQHHQQFKDRPIPPLRIQTGDSRDNLIKYLRGTPPPELVYFFCHGGEDGNVCYIRVGSESERGFTRSNIRGHKINWSQSHPLVFINGCHTAALQPQRALDLISGFIENAAASGVIGTEITCFESLARPFAEHFFDHFFAGVEAGEALRRARLALLKLKNPLGLIYLPFMLPSLRLKEAS